VWSKYTRHGNICKETKVASPKRVDQTSILQGLQQVRSLKVFIKLTGNVHVKLSLDVNNKILSRKVVGANIEVCKTSRHSSSRMWYLH
jgi:hypothetical protein